MTDIKVTQADLRRRQRIHKITGYVDMDLELAKELARHRIEAQRPLLEALDVATRLLWERCEEIDNAIKQSKGE